MHAGTAYATSDDGSRGRRATNRRTVFLRLFGNVVDSGTPFLYSPPPLLELDAPFGKAVHEHEVNVTNETGVAWISATLTTQ